MAGLYGSRTTSASSASSSSSSPYRLLYLLTLLPLALAAFAFSLQWRGELNDPATISRFGGDESKLPGSSPSNSHSFTSASALDCTDPLHRSSFPAFPYRSDWKYRILQAHPKICITTSTSAGLDQILPWLFYHQVIGVTNFFLFVEGKAASPNVTSVLASIPGVKLVFRTKELEEQQSKSRIWNETWLSSFFFRPCNYELFVKQSLNMEMAIVMAREAGMDWIIHLDTDELLHPAGAGEYSLRRLLADVEKDVDMVIFPNYETAIERDDITDPFTEDCSAGACERNWSAYSLIHTKIRNRLSTAQLEKLVYCRANMKLVRAYHALGTPKQADPTHIKMVTDPSSMDEAEQQIRNEQDEIIQLLHRELESVDRRVTRSRARASAIPLHEHATDPHYARRESIRKGKLPIRSSQKRANEAVRLIESSADAEDDDLGQTEVPIMAEPEYDEEGNVLTDGDLLSSAESSSSSNDEF